jgi:1-deoxy-D-xylulose 5-phosphate reductoisomerase
MKKRFLVLGSTGSIGTQTVRCGFQKTLIYLNIEGIACNSNIELAEKKQRIWGENGCNKLIKNNLIIKKTIWYWGDEGILEMIEKSKAELVVMAISEPKVYCRR